MSFVERRDVYRPATGEAPFNLDEVFFSRTDERGVIEAGNFVFRRVADFDWPELIGAPHKIIRHPDMPRAVFWLLWDRLKQGRPVGAYVKNKARDGLYYWVYAVVTPCEDGYLSVRIKPTTPLLETVKEVYGDIRRIELEQKPEPEESAQMLLERLAELGFEGLDDFCAQALSQELTARNEGLDRAPLPRVTMFGDMLKSAAALGAETTRLVQEFNAMRTIPHNMRVIASRMEPMGGPISTLSQNYAAISAEMSEWFGSNVVGPDSNFATIRASVNTSLLREGLAIILAECDTQLQSERRRLDQIDMEKERRILNDLLKKESAQSKRALETVSVEAARIRDACETMNRHLLGLSTTRVLCKIESARSPATGAGLSDIIAQLKVFQERISAQLEHISQHSNLILAQSSRG